MYCSGTSFFVLLLNGGNKVRLQIKLIKKQSDLICGYMVWRCCGLTINFVIVLYGQLEALF